MDGSCRIITHPTGETIYAKYSAQTILNLLENQNLMVENGIRDVITSLERRKTAIEQALEALRKIEAGDGHQPGIKVSQAGATAGPKRKGRMSPEGKKRLIAALKKRWAAKKAAQGVVSAGPARAERSATKRRGISAAGRKRLAEAMRKRWAVKRAGSAVK
jgi:hypothetical protein